MRSRDTRVIASHSIARLALRLGGIFALVALLWAAVVLARGGPWWGPLHALVAGTVLLSISGASQMFTSWSGSGLLVLTGTLVRLGGKGRR